MALTRSQKSDQEGAAAALVGRRLNGVTYVSLDVDGYEPKWGDSVGDSVDFGLDLAFGGNNLSVGWVQPSADYEGLRLVAAPLLSWRDAKAISTDVGASTRWSSIVGDQVAAVRLDWRPWAQGSSTDYLVGVHLGFSGGREITLALAEIVDGMLIASATNVAVLFDYVPVP
jgi:hypothetical protein